MMQKNVKTLVQNYMRQLIRNWPCPTGWNCKKMGRNQALPLLPDRVLGANYIKEVPMHQKNIKFSEYLAVPPRNLTFK